MITKSIQKHYNSLKIGVLEIEIMGLKDKKDKKLNDKKDQSCLANSKGKNKEDLLESPLKLKSDLDSENSIRKPDKFSGSVKKTFRFLSLDQSKVNSFVKGKSFFKKEIKVTKFAILIIISFCVSWLPYTILAVIGQFVKNRETIVTPNSAYFATLFAKSSTLFNPILYLILKQRCKSKLFAVLSKLVSKDY